MKTDQTIYIMSKTEEITWRSIAHVRWLQIQELKHKYPNDADLGAAVRELVNKTPHCI